MGLLNRIESGIDLQKTSAPTLSRNNDTLLKKPNSAGMSFYEFTKANNLNHCAVFSKINNSFVITNSIGFDGESISKSLSSTDFWDGLINKNAWTFFSKSNNSLAPFIQFFSASLKEKIEFIGTYYDTETILFLAYEKAILPTAKMNRIFESFRSSNLLKENVFLKSASSKTPVLQISFNYAAALDDCVSKSKSFGSDAILATNYRRVLQSEFEYKLMLLSNSAIDFIKPESNKIICEVYSKSNLTAETLKQFLTLNFSAIFGSSVNLISYAN